MQDGVGLRFWYLVPGSASNPHSICFHLCVPPIHLLVSVSSRGTGSSLGLARASSSKHDQNPKSPVSRSKAELVLTLSRTALRESEVSSQLFLLSCRTQESIPKPICQSIWSINVCLSK